MIRVGIIGCNAFRISQSTKKGTEIFLRIFLKGLSENEQAKRELAVSVFASKDSVVPFPLLHVGTDATWGNKKYSLDDNKLFELALISKAFSMQDQFDLFHVHMGNGEFFIPFAPFVKKPILVTMHAPSNSPVRNEYFSHFSKQKNIHFVAISESQRKMNTQLSYAATIHHGISTSNYEFNEEGGDKIMWAGRAVPEKGLDTALRVIATSKKPGKVFPIIKSEHIKWFDEHIIKLRNDLFTDMDLDMNINVTRTHLVQHYQQSKVLLFPVVWEEPFGLVLIETLSSGTPVIAFARGAVPEIIQDGVTGFLINPSDTDIRGDFQIKKTGIDGFIEAVERIYSLSPDEYKMMRKACRSRVENHFTVQKMVSEYRQLYTTLAQP